MGTSIVVQDASILIGGILNYQTGKDLLDQVKKVILSIKDKNLTLDLSAVEHSSSVGIALLLALLRFARQHGKTLKIINLPKYMQQIAAVSNVLPLLNTQ